MSSPDIGSQGREHRLGHRAFLLTFLALLALAAASFGLSFVHLGVLSLPAAMIISLAKAVLVVLVFMELVVQRTSSRVVVVVATFMLVVLVVLVLGDVWTRSTPLLTP